MRPSTKRSDGGPRVRKSTLFCPECPFESPLPGAWRRVTTDATRELRCPECGSVVDSRPCRRTPLEAD